MYLLHFWCYFCSFLKNAPEQNIILFARASNGPCGHPEKKFNYNEVEVTVELDTFQSASELVLEFGIAKPAIPDHKIIK